MNTFNYPKVCSQKNNKVYVYFYINNIRYRIYNGKRINSNINPNSYPFNKREEMANLLAAEVYNYIIKGGIIKEYKSQKIITGNLNDKELIKNALNIKLNQNISESYKTELKYAFKKLSHTMSSSSLSKNDIINTLSYYNNTSSYNSIRKNLNAILNKAVELGLKENPINKIKRCRIKTSLNRPIENLSLILKELKLFNKNLYICSLMTYGCLLRPHREIRELTWGDFSEDLKYINLSGHRNKSGRNRIVPVPLYIREILVKGDLNNNVFSNKPQPLNKDYFKTLWSRFKKQSNLIEQGQTLYSFRHSGAIEIFKRTGSLTKLQKAMGHSSINVSLTYLRGLEIAELKEEDMPIV